MSASDRPHDWIRVSVVTLLVAAAGAVVSIVVTTHRHGSGGSTYVASTTTQTVTTTTTTPPTTTAKAPVVTHTTTTRPPSQPNGRTAWPPDLTGWTIVLGSYPVTAGKAAALAAADRAARSGLPDVGVLESASYASLHPGYYVVFTGEYDSEAQAQTALRVAAASGFAGAYPREISR
jgi:hypothetical protein